MLAIVYLSMKALADAGSMATLAALAVEHEIVLVCDQFASADVVIPALREGLPRRQVLALLVYGPMSAAERGLVEELLDEGKMPLILTAGGPLEIQAEDWSWLEPDKIITLPRESHVT